MNSERTVIAIQSKYGGIGTEQCQSVTGHTNGARNWRESTATLIQGMPVAPESRSYLGYGIAKRGRTRFRK